MIKSSPAKSVVLRLLLAMLVTVFYGLAIYVLIWVTQAGVMVLISGALLLSMGIGSLLTVLFDPQAKLSTSDIVVPALITLLLICLLTVIFFAEGIVCLIMAVPILVPGLLLGVSVTRGTIRWWQNRRGAMMVVALPLLVLPLEIRMDWPDYHGFVSTEVIIAAPADIVWTNTVEIRDIDPDTLRFTPSHNLMFFPRPLDARLDFHGEGATRFLSWTKGIHFRENITEWEQDRRLGWTFGFNPNSIPAEIDSHLRPDSEASELLRGEYVLEPLPDGRTKLVLTTHYKVSLPWNGYGRWWANRLLSDFHGVVLDVVKRRAEAAASPSAPQS